MKIIKMVLKGVACLICVAIIYLLVSARFGIKEYTLQCNGELKYKDGPTLINNRLILKVEKYRSILFWAVEDGNIFIEGDIFAKNYSFKCSGGYLNFYEPGSDESIVGAYRMLTDRVVVQSALGRYDGLCASHKTALPPGDFKQ